MARISKETYGQLLESIGYEQHPVTKTLYVLNINDKQYVVDLKGREPDVFRVENGMDKINDLNDDIIKNTIAMLTRTKGPERAKPVDLLSLHKV